MKTIVSLLLLAFISVAPAAQTNSALLKVEQVLKPVLAGLTPRPSVEYTEPWTLTVRYRTQPFLVHPHFMTGDWGTNVVSEVGPSVTGFVLVVNLQARGEINQAVTPQTVNEPYWQTFLDVTPVSGTTNQIYWALSYSTRTNAKTIDSLKKALTGLADAKSTEARKQRFGP